MRILITGSNGFVGRKLVAFCLEKGLTFIATSKGKNRNPDCPDYQYLSLDVSNKLEINQIFEALYPTLILHTAKISDSAVCKLDPESCEQVNIDGTILLFKACEQYQANFRVIHFDEKDTEKISYKILDTSNYQNWSIDDLKPETELDFLFQ